MIRQMRERIFLLTLPVLLVLSLGSTPLIDLLYDQRYRLAGRYLAIMAVAGAIGTLPTVYHHAMTARGDSRTPFILISISTTARLVGLVFGYNVGGVDGMLIGAAVAGVIYYVVVTVVAMRAGWFFLRTDASAIAAILAVAWLSWKINL